MRYHSRKGTKSLLPSLQFPVRPNKQNQFLLLMRRCSGKKERLTVGVGPAYPTWSCPGNPGSLFLHRSRALDPPPSASQRTTAMNEAMIKLATAQRSLA